jgi:SAM-dependent methyltransferase
MTRDTAHALSFGQAVGDYERGRPNYPREAVDWLLASAHEALGRPVADAADVGAGTGKFTESLVAHGLAVTGVDPDPGMLTRLARNHPSVTALAGSAEQLPLDDASVDLVTFAQAWHWVDVAGASAEVTRVLRAGGSLGLVWNIRDASVDWVERLGDIIGASVAEQYDSLEPSVATPLEVVAFAEFAWECPMSREQLLAMVTSRSYVIAMGDAERHALLERVGELLETHPQVAGTDEYRMPYLTRVTVARVVR